MQPVDQIPAVYYDARIFKTHLHYIRNIGIDLKEIFIPTHKLVFNEEWGASESEKPQNVHSKRVCGPDIKEPLTEIQLPSALVEKIVSVAQRKFELERKQKELENEVKEISKTLKELIVSSTNQVQI